MKFPVNHKAFVSWLPWTAGAGLATGQMMLTTQCTLPALGICTGCAGCAVALVSLVSWGAIKTERSSRDDGAQKIDDPTGQSHE